MQQWLMRIGLDQRSIGKWSLIMVQDLMILKPDWQWIAHAHSNVKLLLVTVPNQN